MGEPESQKIEDWAAENKISPDFVKLLMKDGFTSTEALALLDKEDIDRKIPPRPVPLDSPECGETQECAPQQLTAGGPGDNPGNTEDRTTTDPAGVLRKDSRQAAGSNPQSDPYITAVVGQLQAAQTSGGDQGQTIATADTATARIATSASASAPPQNISWNDP